MDTELVMGLIPLAGGFLLDKILGDPLWLPHPVVGFGKLISRCERRGNQGTHRKRNGAWTAIGLVVLVFLVSKGLLEAAALLHPWVKIALSVVAVFYCLAGKTLIDEVRMVFEAADTSLEAGRKQVARIVGRDTSALTDQEVRTAALEPHERESHARRLRDDCAECRAYGAEPHVADKQKVERDVDDACHANHVHGRARIA